jgi:serine/threonine protein kinase
VQLGAYRLVKGKEREDPSYASHTYDGRHGRGDSADSVEKNWKVCAGKRFSPDAESQIAGLSEAAMLLRLKDCENILKFIGLKDERDEEVAGPSKHATAAGAARGVALASRLAKPKLEHIVTGSTASFNGPDSRSLPPSPLAATSPATPTLGLAAIALNDIHEDDKPLAALASVRRSSTLGSRNSLSSLRDATPKSAREAVDSNGADAAPRLVLLTEYCALGNLATFTQHHGPVHLGRALFFKFAIDLMRAIEACHAKNVIHGDVKPHNCMVSWFSLIRVR